MILRSRFIIQQLLTIIYDRFIIGIKAKEEWVSSLRADMGNIRRIKILGYCLVVGLIASLTLVMAACSSKSVSTSVATSGTTHPVGTLSSIAVTPSSPPNLKAGFTQQFKATATYSDGSTEDITDEVTWTSSDSNRAAFISAGGLLTGMKAGTTSITASLSGQTSPPVNITVYVASMAP